MAKSLETIWKNAAVDLPESVCQSWWKFISEKYEEEGRKTHNHEYLLEKCKELDDFSSLIKNIKAFTIALFFQYLEYSPTDDDECNEKNVQSFIKFANEAGINKDSNLFKEVIYLLEGSSSHSTEEHKMAGAYGDTDLHYFLDLDMITLGSSNNRYVQYTKDIQSEYSTLDSETYKILRKKVLQSFLLIPNIFATKRFRDKYEAQARKNIQDEIKGLS
ncbi:conserved hypothetical protein [Pediculus humanus corporis]|uniref:Uncharacterized protein n=1 Tax=Pediculus humanus subsp. corporis TaxID=121224 RepID=E0VMH8_PEDHC|nr:uncharacterized protein Phum_PHUM309520 [Pediculus humanus corporis]EEB14584.1 conserved hypothetical protein [Pediculus humanus corporis]